MLDSGAQSTAGQIESILRIFLSAGEDSAANSVFMAKEQDQHQIENSQFGKEIPDRLTQEEQCEEQDHARIGGEEIQPFDRRFGCACR